MHNPKIEKFFHKLLYIIELMLAALTIIVLVGNFGMEAYRVILDTSYFPSSDIFLDNILSIVVGLEFVKMMIDLTPGNILEVVSVAIARHIILVHDDPFSLLAGVAALAGMFAIRRFLLRRRESKMAAAHFFCSTEAGEDGTCPSIADSDEDAF